MISLSCETYQLCDLKQIISISDTSTFVFMTGKYRIYCIWNLLLAFYSLSKSWVSPWHFKTYLDLIDALLSPSFPSLFPVSCSPNPVASCPLPCLPTPPVSLWKSSTEFHHLCPLYYYYYLQATIYIHANMKVMINTCSRTFSMHLNIRCGIWYTMLHKSQ